MKHSIFNNPNTDSSKITGYAIIQLPDLMLFAYGRIKKLKCVRNVATTKVMAITNNQSEVAPATDVITSCELQNKLEGRESQNGLSRLSNVEYDITKIFKKLDDITSAIDSINAILRLSPEKRF